MTLTQLLNDPLDPLIGETVSHYEVHEKLGRGGMGIIYKARDTRLGRLVALKFVRDEFSGDADTVARFRREALLIASLNHPNIASVYGFEEYDEKRFIVMELVEGETLADRLKRPMPFEECLRVAFQVAEALGAAHQKEIVHRDLKPANIKITLEGAVKVLDFGLAKRLTWDPALGLSTAFESKEGTLLGSIPYMSPEQLMNKEVDHRTDLFALGAVLYEMSAGRAPFQRNSPAETIAAIQREDPEPLARLNPSLPRGFNSLVEKLLEKDPARRYQSAQEVLDGLRQTRDQFTRARIWNPFARDGEWNRLVFRSRWSLVVVLLLFLPIAFLMRKPGTLIDGTGVVTNPQVIAVIPLKNSSGSPDAEILASALTDSLINTLAQNDSLRVRPRTMTEIYKTQPTSWSEISKALGAALLIEGSVLPSQGGESIHINVVKQGAVFLPLVYPKTANQVADLGNLGVSDEIARDVADKIGITFTPQEKARLQQQRHVNKEAGNHYAAGQVQLIKRTPEALQKAIMNFRNAIGLDGKYAQAYAGLARAYLLSGTTGYAQHPSYFMPKAQEAASKALEFNSGLAEANATLATVAMSYDWKWKEAERYFDRALALDSSNSVAHHWYALYWAAQGNLNRAEQHMTQAKDLDPGSSVITAGLGVIAYYKRDYEKAEKHYKEALELEEDSTPAHLGLLILYLKQERWDAALEKIRKGSVMPGEGGGYLVGAFDRAFKGQFEEADELLRKVREGAGNNFVPAIYFAAFWAVFDKPDKSIYWLSESIKDRSEYLIYINVDPLFDSIRQHQHYPEILRQIGLTR